MILVLGFVLCLGDFGCFVFSLGLRVDFVCCRFVFLLLFVCARFCLCV